MRPADNPTAGALRALAETLAALAERVGSPAPAESEFVDSSALETPQRTIRGAVKRGEIDGFRVGKQLLVRRAQYRAWVEQHRVPVKQVAAQSEHQPPVRLLDRLGPCRRVG
jgi:excisionase family DNA binding protein